MRWLAAALLVLQGNAPEEYAQKLQQLRKNAAGKHHAIGDYLATSQMHLWAREQFNKAVELDPDHEGARKKLGYKKGENGWENDPTAKVEFKNKKEGADLERVRKSYNERVDSASKDLGKQWADLAAWCKKAGLAAEGTAALQKVLEYDPANANARKELGYEKDPKGGWVSKVERELRAEMRDGLAKAPPGAAATEQTEVEEKLALRNRKREAAHFLIESPHLSDKDLAGLVQHAEHAYAMFHKIFGETDLFQGRKMNSVILKDKPQHERYVDVFRKGSPAEIALSKKSAGSMGFPRTEQYQDTRPIESVQDMLVHSVAQICSAFNTGNEAHWIHEGVAYHFTRLIKGTALTMCVDLAGTGTAGDGKNYQDPANWPVVCRVWVREGKDPAIDAILKCTNVQELDGAETVKAWSLVEFLIAEHREKFIALCRALRENTPVEEALRKVFDWSTKDFDDRWKAYVRMAY
jgi:hypothetical protein